MISFTLSFEGRDTDRHEIDFYDVAQALIGFQRSLAITTHLVLNGEVITQAPSLKNARVFATPPEEGSWKILATITQQQLADRLKKPQSFVAKYENGERRLDMAEFMTIAEELGADPEKIMEKIK